MLLSPGHSNNSPTPDGYLKFSFKSDTRQTSQVKGSVQKDRPHFRRQPGAMYKLNYKCGGSNDLPFRFDNLLE